MATELETVSVVCPQCGARFVVAARVANAEAPPCCSEDCEQRQLADDQADHCSSGHDYRDEDNEDRF